MALILGVNGHSCHSLCAYVSLCKCVHICSVKAGTKWCTERRENHYEVNVSVWHSQAKDFGVRLPLFLDFSQSFSHLCSWSPNSLQWSVTQCQASVVLLPSSGQCRQRETPKFSYLAWNDSSVLLYYCRSGQSSKPSYIYNTCVRL